MNRSWMEQACTEIMPQQPWTQSHLALLCVVDTYPNLIDQLLLVAQALMVLVGPPAHTHSLMVIHCVQVLVVNMKWRVNILRKFGINKLSPWRRKKNQLHSPLSLPQKSTTSTNAGGHIGQGLSTMWMKMKYQRVKPEVIFRWPPCREGWS